MDNQIPIVIYDGECRLCLASIKWLKLSLNCSELSFHTADLAKFGLTHEECEKQVIAIYRSQTYKGAEAVSFLLNARGNKFLSSLIKRSGRLGESGYRWIATHRNSIPIKSFTIFLERASNK
jgi:predicted DCC family thiol-disulfide oxidoreductase YuxK